MIKYIQNQSIVCQPFQHNYNKYDKNLTILILDRQKIQLSQLQQISLLSNLIHLNITLHSNALSFIIQLFRNLKLIKTLILFQSNLTDQHLTGIIHLSNLQSLKLDNNNISGKGGHLISVYLKNLLQLDLSNNRIDDQGCLQISENLKDLKRLHLGYNNIGDKGMRGICKNLKKVNNLNMSNNNIYEIQDICELQRLQQLNLSNNKISSLQGMIRMNCNKLRSLTLSHNLIQSPLPLQYIQFPYLIHLSLNNNSISSLSLLKTQFPKIKQILYFNPLILSSAKLIYIPYIQLNINRGQIYS